jgi:hypothetical protein
MTRSWVVVIGILAGAVALQVAALTWIALRQQQLSHDLQQFKTRVVEEQDVNFSPSTTIEKITQPNVIISPIATVSTNPLAISTLSATLRELRDQIDTLQTKINSLPKSNSSQKTSVEVVGSTEAVLFMGSGSTTNRDWTTLPGTALSVTPLNFGSLREVHFEAGLSIEGGIAEARLIDVTTGAIYYDSHLQHDRDITLWQTSPPLNIPSQTGMYAVQLRSSSGELAKLDGARLRLLIKK